MDSINFLPGWD